MRISLLQKTYRKALARYQALEPSAADGLYCRAFRAVITSAVKALMKWRRFHFPERVTGGFYWIWRFRFEFLMGWFEQECTPFCRELIKPGMTVLDIGAHIGFYSRLFSKLVGPAGQVISIEANPENFAVLRKNVPPDRYPNVRTFNLAASDCDGARPLYISPGHSNHSLLPGYTEARKVIEIDSLSMDTFLTRNGIAAPGFIKSDTEGAEPLVIAGLRRTLSGQAAPMLLLEYNPMAIRCGGTEPEALLAALREAGFNVDAILPGGSLGNIPELHGSESANLLCRKTVVSSR